MKRSRGRSLAWSNLWWSFAVNTFLTAIIAAATGLIIGAKMAADPDGPIREEHLAYVVLGSALIGALLAAVLTLIGEWPKTTSPDGRQHCPRCGYDLRGDRARGCPECGWNRDKPPQPPIDKPTGPYDLEE